MRGQFFDSPFCRLACRWASRAFSSREQSLEAFRSDPRSASSGTGLETWPCRVEPIRDYARLPFPSHLVPGASFGLCSTDHSRRSHIGENMRGVVLHDLDMLRLGRFQLLKIRFRQLNILPLGEFIALHQFAPFHHAITDGTKQLLFDAASALAMCT